MSVLWCEWPQDSGVSPSSSSGVGEYHTASHYQDESSIHLRSAHCWRFCGFSYHPPRLRFRGQFHRWDLCQQLRLPTSITETAYEIQSITGKPLTRRHVRHSVGPLQLQIGQLYQEELHLLVLEGSTVDIILGRPWLVQHDPHLSWKTGEILKWGNSCFPHCFPWLPRPLTTVPVQLPIHSKSIESPV